MLSLVSPFLPLVTLSRTCCEHERRSEFFDLIVPVSCIHVPSQVFAPIMGFSACFGGPMLNILLGVGISGSYIISQSAKPYHLPLSPTLIANGFGLLVILLTTSWWYR
jgi:Ca2+/Na+ antiporter